MTASTARSAGSSTTRCGSPSSLLRGLDRPRHPCVISGPTCDSLDVIAEDLPMPELGIGELLIARQIGAYTVSCATDFNFFPRAKVIAVNVEP